jgi:hypothetical protein
MLMFEQSEAGHIDHAESSYGRAYVEPRAATRRSVMQLAYEVDASLPPLAWAASIILGKDAVRVVAGVDVQRDGDVFWEGLSLTPENPGAALNEPLPLSTGAVARQNEVAFWTPGHILDRLFIVAADGRIVVSNSLPFVLKASGSTLLADSLHYPWHFGRIVAHSQRAPLTQGHVQIISNANVAITREGEVRVSAKPAPPVFDTYDDYLGQLHRLLDRVAEANRRASGGAYKLVSTLSTGYDSTAASVLAKRIGLSEALSIVDSRSGADDSGEALAASMGLSLKTARRTAYREAGWDAERLFYVFGQPEDIWAYPFKDDLKGALLFTGLQGDQMWNREPGTSLCGTWSWDPGGATMQEFRLRAGFVHMPPAAFGWQHADRLLRITRSPEMAPWSLPTSYDRPIPRRIAEDSGVPRELFGMEKKAVSIALGIDHVDYIGTDALGISGEMSARLTTYAQSVSGLKCRTEMALSNGVHQIVRRLHRSAHDIKTDARPGPALENSGGKAWNLLIAADRLLPVRRKFMAPFSMLNFSTQIANASLAGDYVTFDR